jgi:hypothetical protein
MGSMELQDRLRSLWFERLDAGADPQGSGYLALRVKGEWRYCCLGIACEVYREVVGTLAVEEGTGPRVYGGEIRYLPEEVREAFGFRSICGTDDALLWKSEEHAGLADANDSGELTFPDLAELVRRNRSRVFVE